MLKNSQPFGKIYQKTAGSGDLFDSHCIGCAQITVRQQ